MPVAGAGGDSGLHMRKDGYLPGDFRGAFRPEKTAGPFSRHTRVNLFADFGMAWDHARQTRESAAGAGIGLTWYHEHFTLSGIVAVPLVEGPIGLDRDPIVQVRLDARTW
jgi:hemolysin activation/secretion protein